MSVKKVKDKNTLFSLQTAVSEYLLEASLSTTSDSCYKPSTVGAAENWSQVQKKISSALRST